MATLLARIVVKEGCEARFEALAADLYRATHADEDGVARYEYARGERPRHYYTLLSFADYHAFLAHQASEHHEAATGPLRECTEDISLEWLDPVDGASPLPATEHRDPAPGSGETEHAYARLMPARTQPWWVALRP